MYIHGQVFVWFKLTCLLRLLLLFHISVAYKPPWLVGVMPFFWLGPVGHSCIIYIIHIYIPRPTVSFKFEGSCKKTGFQTQNPVLGSWWWLSMLWMHLDLNQHRCKPFCSQPGAHVHPNAAGLPSPSVVCDEMWKQGYLESFKAEISRILLSSTRLLIALGLTYCFYSIDWRIVVI